MTCFPATYEDILFAITDRNAGLNESRTPVRRDRYKTLRQPPLACGKIFGAPVDQLIIAAGLANRAEKEADPELHSYEIYPQANALLLSTAVLRDTSPAIDQNH
jgi:hypothetical protein